MKRTYQREWAFKKRRAAAAAAAASASFTAADDQDQCEQDYENDQNDLLDQNDLSEQNDFLDQIFNENEQDNQDPDKTLELEEGGDLFYDRYQETEMVQNNYDIYSNLMDLDSDSDDEIIEPEPDLTADLRAWASLEQVTMKSCDSLLKILKQFHPQLPKTARTLLQTKKNIVITNQSNMEVYRFNVENSLKSHLGR